MRSGAIEAADDPVDARGRGAVAFAFGRRDAAAAQRDRKTAPAKAQLSRGHDKIGVAEGDHLGGDAGAARARPQGQAHPTALIEIKARVAGSGYRPAFGTSRWRMSWKMWNVC
jgi:hypothetical protein